MLLGENNLERFRRSAFKLLDLHVGDYKHELTNQSTKSVADRQAADQTMRQITYNLNDYFLTFFFFSVKFDEMPEIIAMKLVFSMFACFT